MPRTYVRDNVPLSRFGVLVAQLESIVASASQQPPDPLLCFDLLSDLISSIHDEPKDSILLWQRKCEDALFSLLTLGAKRPVRHLASVAMARIISNGDPISMYSRVSSLQGFLSDGAKKSEPQKVAGASQCLGELYRTFGRKITTSLLETVNIAMKLMKFHEDFVRQEALNMLKSALEGSSGTAATSAYSEAFRLITKFAIGDKSFVVRIAAARCLKAFSDIGGPGVGVGELDNSAAYCVKALEDPFPSVRDAFAEALGSILALILNPESQVHPRGKGPSSIKKLDGALQRHIISPFIKASGVRSEGLRIGLTFSWVFFLQAIRLKYLYPDSELESYALQVIDMLHTALIDAHALACVLYILRVGVTDQMTESTQRRFLIFLGKQLQSPDGSPSMKIAALRTLSYALKTLGEIPVEFKEVFDDTVVGAISDSSQLVRIEAALTLRTMAEVDPECVGGLISYGVTTLSALRESVAFDKGSSLKVEIDNLHGQATVLAALVSVSPMLPLGYPARLPQTVLKVSKQMLMESCRNLVAATAEKEAAWTLLSSLLSSMPREELEDEVFDILSLWADLFNGNPELEVRHVGDLESKICLWSAAIAALTEFIKSFITSSSVETGILLHPVLVYLSSALSYISVLASKDLPNLRSAMDIFTIRVLLAFQSLPDPMAYKSDHLQIIQLCSAPFRNASAYDESSCLRRLLDKRDAWLGPWSPGRDWFEDELRSFQGGNDSLVPCVWENELPSFPMPETIKKTLVNQKLLCFGIMFASQDNGGMLSLLGLIEQCLKAGKKQPWHAATLTNICVGLLAGLKALLALRSQSLELDILNGVQAIFQTILAEGDICASHRRASSEGLGLLARLATDIYTAKMTRSLLNDLCGATDTNYAGSISFALGCIHRSAGGMALSSLVPATVSSVSSLAKSSMANLQIWSMHGLILTIEAAGLSYVSHVQAILGLAMDILFSKEDTWVDLQQGVGRLINAVVAVLGPELSPGSIFFSRCKAVIAEIRSWQETATLLESVRFTQQLVIFAPQAVSVHVHVQTLLPTLSSKQPTLRHLAVSILRHLIEKDPISIIGERIEDSLFHMLDEETDPEIGNLVRSTIARLLYASCPSCPSHWISLCRNMVLATSMKKTPEQNNTDDYLKSNVEDDKNMVSGPSMAGGNGFHDTDKHLRYRTRIFAAECLSLLPEAVGKNPAHFDLTLAREQSTGVHASHDWLVIHLQELISLAYQISTIQFESMQPIGVGLLTTIMTMFESLPDPELPGHLLLEQYQAQLLSAVRTALNSSSGPILLEAGLQLATKILTSGVLTGDKVAVKRIFSLISRPLDDIKDLYYPSFAEWVSCKIKVRLLAAHASLKCYVYSFLRKHEDGIPEEFSALLPLFSEKSSTLGKFWIQILKEYSYISLRLQLKKDRKPFLDEIQSPLISSKLHHCLEEAFPTVLEAIALDAAPLILNENINSMMSVKNITNCLISGYPMVELNAEEFHFLLGFSLQLIFQGQHTVVGEQIISLSTLKVLEILSPVFQSLSNKIFLEAGFLSMDTCWELLQIFSYFVHMDNMWHSLGVSVLSQIVQNSPVDFLEKEDFTDLIMELCLAFLLVVLQRKHNPEGDTLINQLLNTLKTVVVRSEAKKRSKSAVVATLLIGYKCTRRISTELSFLKLNEFFKNTDLLLKRTLFDNSTLSDGEDEIYDLRSALVTCLSEICNLTRDCTESISLLEKKRTGQRKLVQLKLAFSLEQALSFTKLAYEHELLSSEGKEGNKIFSTVLKHCAICMGSVLSDSSVQVQAIGLQVLKNLLQREANEEGSSIALIVAGELLTDILNVIQNLLKKPLTKESVSIVGECLRILVLLQRTPKTGECQRSVMTLLLQAIIMVFMSSETNCSQETSDARSIAITIVSHIAQIPSSAVHFKEILSSMPASHRQRIQDVVRASVSQDQQFKAVKNMAPLKLVVPVETKGTNPPPPTREQITNNSVEEGEDEDDWDSFQSFPASTSGDGDFKSENTKDSTRDENYSVSGTNCEHVETSELPDKVKEDQKCQPSDKATCAVVLETPEDTIQQEPLCVPQITTSSSSPSNDYEEKKDDTNTFADKRLSDLQIAARTPLPPDDCEKQKEEEREQLQDVDNELPPGEGQECQPSGKATHAEVLETPRQEEPLCDPQMLTNSSSSFKDYEQKDAINTFADKHLSDLQIAARTPLPPDDCEKQKEKENEQLQDVDNELPPDESQECEPSGKANHAIALGTPRQGEPLCDPQTTTSSPSPSNDYEQKDATNTFAEEHLSDLQVATRTPLPADDYEKQKEEESELLQDVDSELLGSSCLHSVESVEESMEADLVGEDDQSDHIRVYNTELSKDNVSRTIYSGGKTNEDGDGGKAREHPNISNNEALQGGLAQDNNADNSNASEQVHGEKQSA